MTATITLGDRCVPPLGFGCMSLSHPGRIDDLSVRVLRAAYEGGVRHFDTADKYGAGHNEQLVARALGRVRSEVLIATKVGFVGSPGRDERPVDGTPEHIRAACHASLQRLRTDRIDLLYLHRVDPHVPVEETVGAMADLVGDGSVAHLGLSEVGPETLARAAAVHPIAAVQSEYSLWSRDVEDGVLDACREQGATFVAYSPLGIGFLTGRYRRTDELPAGNRLARSPRMTDENLAPNLELVERLALVAEDVGCTPAQLALAWVLDRGVAAVPGSSSEEHLHENLAASQVVLDDQLREVLDQTFRRDRVAGARKSPPGLALTDR